MKPQTKNIGTTNLGWGIYKMVFKEQKCDCGEDAINLVNIGYEFTDSFVFCEDCLKVYLKNV